MLCLWLKCVDFILPTQLYGLEGKRLSQVLFGILHSVSSSARQIWVFNRYLLIDYRLKKKKQHQRQTICVCPRVYIVTSFKLTLAFRKWGRSTVVRRSFSHVPHSLVSVCFSFMWHSACSGTSQGISSFVKKNEECGVHDNMTQTPEILSGFNQTMAIITKYPFSSTEFTHEKQKNK